MDFFSCKLMLFPISEGRCMYANLNFKVVKCEDNETWDGERGGSGSLTLLLDNRFGGLFSWGSHRTAWGKQGA